MAQRGFISITADSQSGSNVSAGGDTFTQNFNPPLSLPSAAKWVSLSVPEVNLWYTSVNLAAGSFEFSVSTDSGSSYTDYSYDYDAGLYSLSGLVQMLNLAASEDGLNVFDNPLFAYTSIEASQKAAIGVWLDDTSYRLTIDWTASANQAIAALLGYDASKTWGDGTSTQVYQYKIAADVANFSSLSYYRVNATIGGTSFIGPNGEAASTIANVTPDVAVGSQILYRPTNPPTTSADFLRNASILDITFSITDDSGNAVTFLENSPWSVRMQIEYGI